MVVIKFSRICGVRENGVIKGTGTRDQNCLDVVWLCAPELVLLPEISLQF